jgi:O-antigen ligase
MDYYPTQVRTRSRVAGQPAAAPALADRPTALATVAFYVFVFSIPFEQIDIGLPNTTISKLLGFLFIGLTLLRPRAYYKRIPTAFYFFLAFIMVAGIMGIVALAELDSDQASRVPSFMLTLIQDVAVFLVAYNTMTDQVGARSISVLISSCTLLSVFEIFGAASKGFTGRATVLDVNPNGLALVLAFGLLCLTGLAYGREKLDRKARRVFWICAPVLSLAFVLTGSRGGAIAFAAGLVMMLFRKTRSIGPKLKLTVIVGLAMVALIIASLQVASIRDRWIQVLTTGDLAGREEILPAAVDVFADRPLLGWGPIRNVMEVGNRLGVRERDTHNLYLWVLTATGITGGLPFFLAQWLCFAAAYRARRGTQGGLPLALVTCILVVNLKGTYFDDKLSWILLGYALASGKGVGRLSAGIGALRPGVHSPVPATELRSN